jgi:CheY-like chemotaxis protein
VHSIVSDHSGMIRVHSQQGEGSTFVISLPAAVNERSIGQNRPLPVMADNPLRLLLVEDEPGIRRVLQHYLQRRGHQVDVAREGGEALTLIAQTAASNPYDVIISDIRMPGIGGDRLLEELQARGDGFDRRIIFISGDAASSQTKRLMDDARVPMLYKPFALEDLSSMVERFAEEIPGVGTRNEVDGTITRQAV